METIKFATSSSNVLSVVGKSAGVELRLFAMIGGTSPLDQWCEETDTTAKFV
jgi:hypothetical protein